MNTTLTEAPVTAGKTEDTVSPKAVPASCYETEMKLLASKAAMTKLRRAPIFSLHARGKGRTRHLETVYYDTADNALKKNGYALRVRRSGASLVQTLKSARGSDPLTRHEWETPVDNMEPQLTRLAAALEATGADDALYEIAEQALIPVFITRVKRHSRILELEHASVEIAFDEGIIESGGRTETISEIELELKIGKAEALYDIALSLLDTAPLRIGTESKSERGYNLRLDRQPQAFKAPAIELLSDDSVDEGVAKLLSGCYRHLLENLAPAYEGRNIDGVHQMRVALRRLRTVSALLKREVPSASLHKLAAEAKALARRLGEVRNWDVFIATTLSAIEEAELPGVDVNGIEKASASFQRNSHDLLRDTLREVSVNRFLLSWGRVIERRGWRDDMTPDDMAILDEPISALAERALTKIHDKALKRGKHFAKLDDANRHELRLTLKKLRYAGEFFVSLYQDREQAGDYLKSLSKLQDVLGADNDITTAQALLKELEQDMENAESQRAIGAIMGWQGHRRFETSKTLRRKWRGFKKREPFWR